jgi:hypothetical protein
MPRQNGSREGALRLSPVAAWNTEAIFFVPASGRGLRG